MAISSGMGGTGREGQEVTLTLRCALEQVGWRDGAGERDKEKEGGAEQVN